MLSGSEITTLRELARLYADITQDNRNDEARRLWTAHNDLRACRPMVLIDQICFSEMDFDGSLRLTVNDEYWRDVEAWLRQAIYQRRHMPVDRVFTPYVQMKRPIINTGWGMTVKGDYIKLEPESEVANRRYTNQITDFESLENIKYPSLSVDKEAEARVTAEAGRVFEGIIEWRFTGYCPHLGLWDLISTWMGVENCYTEIIDRPELMHAIIEKLTLGALNMLDQMDEQGLFDVTSTLCHCSHTLASRLPSGEAGEARPRAEHSWAFGLAQLFTAVSPSVTREFEVNYMRRIFPRMGAIYYGCCERLDDRLDVIAELPNVRKISCSPWSDKRRFAQRLPQGVIMSAKPTPAVLAYESFDEEAARKDLRETIDIAKAENRPLELILKDISTVRHDPTRLFRWAELALEEAAR